MAEVLRLCRRGDGCAVAASISHLVSGWSLLLIILRRLPLVLRWVSAILLWRWALLISVLLWGWGSICSIVRLGRRLLVAAILLRWGSTIVLLWRIALRSTIILGWRGAVARLSAVVLLSRVVRHLDRRWRSSKTRVGRAKMRSSSTSVGNGCQLLLEAREQIIAIASQERKDVRCERVGGLLQDEL